MKRFVEGQDRSQLILLPDCLDDYVGEDNPVRIVDAFIDELDLAVLMVVKEKSKIHLPVLGLVPPRQLQWEPGGELDDPGALRPEREVTEHPTQ